MILGLQRLLLVAGAFIVVAAMPAGAQLDLTPKLVFSTAPLNQPVNLTLRQASLSYDLKVYATQENLQNVRILVEPFLDGSLRTVHPTLTVDGNAANGPKDLKVGDSMRLILKAEFPDLGTYTTFLTPCYKDRMWQPLTVTVNRVAPAAPDLDILDLPTGTAEIHGPGGGGRATIPILVAEKTSQPFLLPVPQLFRLARKDGQGEIGATVAFAVHGERGNLLPEKTAKPQIAHRISIELSDFPEAGLYEGVLRFSVPGAAATTKAFSVYVRESVWILFASVSIGAILSLILRDYLTRRRPRLVELNRAAVLARDLDAAASHGTLDAESSLIASTLRQQLIDVVQGLQLDTLGADLARASLQVLDLKIDLLKEWLALYEETRLVGGAADPDLLKGIQHAAHAMLDPTADTTRINQARSDIAGLWSLIPNIQKAPAPRHLGTSPAPPTWTALVKKLGMVAGSLLASDLLVTAVIVVIAGLMAIQTLWINDLTWGGWQDWIVALLWGLGLHQAGFSGIDALRMTFAK